jgi:hypothetical protein
VGNSFMLDLVAPGEVGETTRRTRAVGHCRSQTGRRQLVERRQNRKKDCSVQIGLPMPMLKQLRLEHLAMFLQELLLLTEAVLGGRPGVENRDDNQQHDDEHHRREIQTQETHRLARVGFVGVLAGRQFEKKLTNHEPLEHE